MITGCNTNVRHRGKLFHVQTEDSGRANPHIISHVYHGGTIIASEKRVYEDRVGSADLDSEVRALIEEQHKSMLDRLAGGELDAAIDERLGGVPAAPAEGESSGATTGGESAGVTTAGLGNGGASTPPAVTDEKRSAPAARQPKSPQPTFGDGVDSQKPLDEVILEYLVDKARARNTEREDRPPRQPRPKG